MDLTTGAVTTTDEFVQDGSVSNLNIGYARMLGSNVSVGLTAGRYAGSLVRTFTRTFGEDQAGDVNSYVERGGWSYTGHHVTAGASGDVGRFHVAASVQLPTSLDAEADDGTEGGDRTFDLPVQLRAGASASLWPGLLVAASVSRADWSSTQDDLAGTDEAGSANGFGVGLEFSRARLWGKDAPLRFGFRRSSLPFSFGSGDVSERIVSGGLGLALNRSNEVVLAAVDLAVERGRRWGLGVSEHFWRATISFQAAGF